MEVNVEGCMAQEHASLKRNQGAARNQLEKLMRNYISKYYKFSLQCEDVGCAYQTRKMPLLFSSGGPVCPACRNSNLQLEYSEAQLYTQLAYFQNIFDFSKAENNLSKEEKGSLQAGKEEKELYDRMKISTDKILSKSAYGIVNLSTLFEGLFQQDSSSF
ncbi:DNA polymerase [Caerostris extrusa]|uniref:DNA polymerase n=1 Tax=Caerostris extrusa TaxID=172846 RepID=A0AAV4TDE4_CAEEX|nr:DNA polymerase [Caerostris extrusa]